MESKMPNIWIMKITPGGSGNTKKYFENLFLNQNCKNLIGYTKEEGKVEEFSRMWQRISIGDLVIVLEGHNRVFGVVEIKSNPFDDDKTDIEADWFYHRRKAKLIKYFDPFIETEAKTNRNTIIEYSGDGAVEICDEIWEIIKEDYHKMKINENMKDAISLLKYKKQIILQGPPGTGKTFIAKKMADELTKEKKLGSPQQIIDDFFRSFNATKPEIIKQRSFHTILLKDFQDKFPAAYLKDLTLEEYSIGTGENNSFCWWIERGLKPLGYYFPGSARSYLIYWSKGKDKYSSHFKHNSDLSKAESLDDAMKLLASMISKLVINKDYADAIRVFGNSYILKILHSYYPEEYAPINSAICLKNALKLFRVDYSNMNVIEMNLKLQEIFLGKKSKFKKDITNIEFMRFLFDHFDLKGNLEIQADEVVVKGESKLIQFHPAYSYEDFVRGITVEMNSNKQPEYKVVNKILADYAKKALDNPSANYVLIIDEINRANLPAVLGELIYALEYRYNPDYPLETTVESMYALKQGKDDEEGDKNLMLPENLYIIGTMNTADRSVGHIDYAIRRRFAFVSIPPSDNVIDEVISDVNLREKSKLLFKKVENIFKEKEVDGKTNKYLSSDFKAEDVQLGHSYFLVTEHDKKKLNMHSGEDILMLKLDYEIKPILNEYLKDGILLEGAKELIENL
jgi:5-methylcytosine-specific restriction protein B